MTWNRSCTEEIRSSESIDERALENITPFLTARWIPVGMRKRFTKCFIWSVILYGSETRITK